MGKDKIRGYCIVAAFTVVLYLGLSNFPSLLQLIQYALKLLAPFLLGVVFAFLLNGILKRFESKIFYKIGQHDNPKIRKLLRPLSLFTTYLVVFFAIGVLVNVVAPQLADSVTQIGNNIPGYVRSLQSLGKTLSQEIPLDPMIMESVSNWLWSMVQAFIDFLPSLLNRLPQIYSVVASMGTSVLNVVIGLICSIYILSSKEKLLSQVRRISKAFLPPKADAWLAQTGNIAADIFSSFLTGKLLDSLIVGIISVVFLTIFQFPYGMLLGVIIGVTNIIPFFGPIIGAIPGIILLFIVDPLKSLFFLIFVVVLQQIDGNILGPRIVGDSVGLPALWVLFSVTVGGALFGVVGMVLGTPVFAVFYTLLGRAVRLRESSFDPPALEPEDS